MAEQNPQPTPETGPPPAQPGPAWTPAEPAASGPDAAPAPAPASAPAPGPTATASARPAARRRRGWLDLVLLVAAVFAVGGVAFALGRMTAPTTSAATGLRGGQLQDGQLPNGRQFPAGGQNGQGGGTAGLFGAGGGGIAIRGEVVEVAADHLTLKLQSGQTVQIETTSSTTYHHQAAATSSDVTPGSEVIVQLQAGAGRGNGPRRARAPVAERAA